MAKIAKRILLVFCSLMFVLCFGIVGVLGLNTNKTIEAKAATPTVAFSKVFENQNNAVWEANGGYNATYLVFEGDAFTLGTGHTTMGIYYTNADGTRGSILFLTWVTVGGSGAQNGENANENTIQLIYTGTIADGCVLHVDEGTEFAGQVLPEVTLYMVGGKWKSPVTFTGVDSVQNNKTWPSEESWQATYLNFEGGTFTEANTGSTPAITYTEANGTQGNFTVWTSGSQIWLLRNTFNRFGNGSTIHIEEGTVVDGQVLPEVNLKVENDVWVKVEPTVPTANYLGVYNDGTTDYNWYLHGTNRRALVLEFDQIIDAGTTGNVSELDTWNGNVLNVTLDGKTRSKSNLLARARVVVAGKNNLIEIVFKTYETAGTIYTTDSTVTSQFANNTKLEIKDSTVNGYKIPDLTFYFNAETQQWQEEKVVVPTVTFTGVDANQNNVQWGTGEFIGVFLNFSADFTEHSTLVSSITYTPVGGTATSFDFTWANFGGLGSANQLQLLINGLTPIADGAVLNIPKGTEVGGLVLPEVTLYMVDGKWATEKPEPKAVTFEKIEWNNDYGGANVLLLKYAGADQYAISNNVLDLTTALGGSITINGTPISAMTDSKIESRPDYGAPFLLIQYDTSYATHGAVLVIPEGTIAKNAILPGLTLYMNAETGKWQDTEPDPLATPKAEYVGIFKQQMDGGVWKAHSLIQIEFDRALAPNTTDIQGAEKNANNSGNLSSQLTLGGAHVTMGSQVNFYVNCFAYATTEGGNVNSAVLEILFIGKKASDFAHRTVLHIPDGTPFGEVQLAEVTLYFNAVSGQWQAEKPAPIVNGFTAVEGGSIRIDKENGGLRFETHLEKATYDSLVATYGKENLKIGTYILPEAYLTLSGKSLRDYVTSYSADGGYYLNISTYNEAKGDFGFANSDSEGNITEENISYYKYYGTISKVKYANYAENFIGVGYLWITDKDGVEYLYLTHDGSWSRNVYEIAKEAYQDTVNVTDSQLYGVTPYFDKVIEISTSDSAENTLIYDIDSVLAARPSYSYTKPTDYTVNVADGVITIESDSNEVYSVIINGVKAGVVEANGTAYADYYALNAELFATAEEAKALNFGIGEPTQELWGTLDAGFNKTFATANLNEGSTATNIAKVNKEYNGNTARIWFQIADVCWPNTFEEFAFLDGSINAIQGVVNDFRAQGVTNIALMSGVANYRSTKNYYKDGTWYTFWEDLNGSIGATPYPNLIVLPGETYTGINEQGEAVEIDEYAEFLALQKEYFKQIALNVKGITTIEILNELETSMLNQTRFGIANGYAPDIALVAQAAMDICKAATDGVKEAGKNIKIMMPALCCVNEKKDGENVTRYDSVKLLEAEYAYIMGENGTKNADDYFQIINIHPYVSISSDTSDTNYLYYEKNGSLTRQTPTQIKERWVKYTNSLRAIFVKNGDAEKPVWITEFGIADYESCNDQALSSSKFSDYIKNKVLRQAQVFQIVYDAIKEMPYIDSAIFFRLGDYNHNEHNYADCGEATYGMIDENGNVKDIGKYMYAIVNGVNVFTDSSYGTLKALNTTGFGDFYSQITAFESAVEGIY